MALTQRPERKSIRASYANENKEILVLNASYSSRNIALTIDMFDEEYCANNKSEIENAIYEFLATFRDVLSEANLPSI